MKIYTRSGDKGQTSLFDGSRVSKTDERIETLGELDELNARVGMLVRFIEDAKLIDFIELEFLQKLQSLILDLGSEIANPRRSDVALAKAEKLSEGKYKDYSEYVTEMENRMDSMDENLDELKNFILPGGTKASSQAHLCRTQARKVERKLITLQYKNETSNKFLNRLSDYFFVLARFLNKEEGKEDLVWR